MRQSCSLLIRLSLAATLAGCAGAGSATPAQRDVVAYIPGGGTFTISSGNAAVSANVLAPLEQVWRRLPTAYDSIGLQLSVIDPKRHSMGNEGIKLRARLGKERLSTYLECGTTQIGPNADSYEVYLTVLTQLDSVAPTMTRMTTSVTAAAKPMQFAQDYSRCTSKTALEKKLLDVVAASVAR